VDAADLIVFQIIDKKSEIQNFAVCLKPPPFSHNVFTFTLFLPEGRVGVAWGPSNKIMLFLPPRKQCLSLHPLISSLNLLVIYPSDLSLSRSLSLSLSLSLSQLRRINIYCTLLQRSMCEHSGEFSTFILSFVGY
jgi:hypothetical protein